MSYSTQVANAINQFLKDDDWKYSFDEEKGRFTFNLNVKSKLQKISYDVRVHDDNYVVFATSPMGAKDCLPQMAEFLCRANYGLQNGNFELDFRDGEIRYKCFVDCDGQVPGTKIVKDSIYIPAAMMKRYGDGIVAVLFGVQTPEEAINSCEKS